MAAPSQKPKAEGEAGPNGLLAATKGELEPRFRVMARFRRAIPRDAMDPPHEAGDDEVRAGAGDNDAGVRLEVTPNVKPWAPY